MVLKIETRCKRCLINFEHVNILKSHLMFDLCGRISYLDSSRFHLKNFLVTKNEIAIYIFIDLEPSQFLFSPKGISQTQSKKSDRNLNSTEVNRKFYQKSSNSIGSSSCSSTSSSCSTISTSSTKPIIENVISAQTSAFSPIKAKKKADQPNSNATISSQPLENNQKCNIMESSQSLSPSTSLSKEVVIKSSKSEENKNLNNNSGQINGTEVGEIGPTNANSNGMDWKITLLDGTQTVELNIADEMGKQKKTHVCLFCGKIYNRKYGLKIHLRTHTG